MKARLVVALVLSTLGLLAFASSGNAQKPIPGIQQTAPWKSLKRYVSFLQSRRHQVATGAKKQTFRITLKNRRSKADDKVMSLFGHRIARIVAKDDRWQKQQIRKIRRTQKRKVAALKAELADRVSTLQAKQAMAVDRVTARYAPQINRLSDQRLRLERKLARTRKPAKREALARKIKRIKDQINDLVADRQSEVENVNSRYQGRIAGVNDLFNARIAKAKASAKRQIRETNANWKRTFRMQLKAAKTRRDTQKDQVAALAARGRGYIEDMPDPAAIVPAP